MTVLRFPIMTCPEKESLQHECSASWNAYESAMGSLGLALDPKIGPVWPRLTKVLSRVEGLIDSRTGVLKSPYLDAIALLREHQTASRRLSRHLHNHRC